MRLGHLVFRALLLVVLAGCSTTVPSSKSLPAGQQDIIAIYFSPTGGCQQAIVSLIDGSKKDIRMQAYVLTNMAIVDALCRASRRGVMVSVILDKALSQSKYASPSVATMLESNIRVWLDAQHAIAHNKVMIVDGTVVVTGSYNFTESAETRNAENIAVLRSEDIARKYLDNWGKHASHSVKVLPKNKEEK